MSIIIQFNSSAFSQSGIAVSSTSQCHSKRNVKLEMVPGIERSNVPGMTDDENSLDVASSSVFTTTSREVKYSINHTNTCFGLPYQDHNYGAPPPPTPPSCSPCPSPILSVPVPPDEDTTLSVISNSTNEDVQEESVTRCICGFEHDDEYMISCDNCLVWQHVDCMGLDRNNIPETYLCDKCEPRKLDRHKAKLLQSRKKGSLTAVKPSASASLKQEPNFNNRIFGKDFKKKSLGLGNNSNDWGSVHKSEFREASNLQRFNYSSDSDDVLSKNTERRPKTRSKRRKREDDKTSETNEQSYARKKSKKHGRERMEAKRSKLRRGKNKESTSTADEEAQDAWEYSLEWCEKNFEDAINNQYTPEIQHLARSLNTQGYEKRYLEQMRTKQCHAYDDGKRKQLVCLRDLPRNSPLIEYKGKFLLASQFHDIHPLYNKRLYPYVLFYPLDQENICVDASMYGNDARFVRRSCKPNAEIRHMVFNGKLHLYLRSTRVIFREDEVTIPLIIHPNDSSKDFECSCGSEECLVKPKKKNGVIEVSHERRRRTRRSTLTADEDSDHSVEVKNSNHSVEVKRSNHTAEVKRSNHSAEVKRSNHSAELKRSTHSEVKRGTQSAEVKRGTHSAEVKRGTHSAEVKRSTLSAELKRSTLSAELKRSTHSVVEVKPSTHSVEVKHNNHSVEGKQGNHSIEVKQTRHQTKISAANEKPKQVTIKTEPIEHQIPLVENTPVPIKDEPEFKSLSDFESDEQMTCGKRKLTREERKMDAIMRAFQKMEQAEKRKQLALEKQKSHHHKTDSSDDKPESEPKKEEKASCVASEAVPKDEEKVAPQTPKKKGKRRRGSGTPSRRRTRTNSGGSDLMSLDESSPTKVSPSVDVNASSIENVIPVPVSSPPPASSSPDVMSPISTVTTASSSHVLKTKRALMNEWLQVKHEANNTPKPIHKEMKWSSSSAVATCYVRCTKDAPPSSGISAAHLRRSNSAGHMKPGTGPGSAKKRWLRQAMYDCHGCEIQQKSDHCNMDPPSNLDNGCLSPNCHGDSDNYGGPGEDMLPTPLKKRRLMRESIESLPSPQSPSTATSVDDTDATTVSNSVISDNSTEHGSDAVENETSCIDKDSSSAVPETSLVDNEKDEAVTNETTEEAAKLTNDLKPSFETCFSSISAVELISEKDNFVTEKALSEETSSEPLSFKEEKTNVVKDSLPMSPVNTGDRVDSKSDSGTGSIMLDNNFNLKASNLDLTMEENMSSDMEISMSEEISGNQSCSTLSESETSDKDLVAQKQSQDLNGASTASSSVNTAASSETNDASFVDQAPQSSNSNIYSFYIIKQSRIGDSNEETELNDLSMQINKDIFPNKDINNQESNCAVLETNDSNDKTCDNETFVNNLSDTSTNCGTADPLNQTVCSPIISCNNVNSCSNSSVQSDDSESLAKDRTDEIDNIKDKETLRKEVDEDVMEIESHSSDSFINKWGEITKSSSLSRCTSSENTSPDIKVCASATQKRKVSLSEYRMRMRENTTKTKSDSESPIKPPATTTSICAISLPDTLPEQVTLAPLPLFEKIRAKKFATKPPAPQIVSKIKKEEIKVEPETDKMEHRENLNERLKREFGFDVSEGARPSPPPPPPPPRLTRPPLQEPIPVAVQSAPFNFPTSPFPRPQFMIPPQVPAAPFLPPQAAVLPPVHPLNANAAQCSLQPPLIPPAHPFTPSMALLRPPQRDYSSVNAQRFAALVQQPPPPPPPHKSYLHVYPSGLYK